MDILKRIIKAILFWSLMFITSVIFMKLIADAFARFVLWTAHIWGMEYK